MASEVNPRPCTSCGKLISDLRNKQTGRLGPIDAEPSPDGNCLIDGDCYSVVAKGLFSADGPRHKNHYSTCPDAKAWREKKKAK